MPQRGNPEGFNPTSHQPLDESGNSLGDALTSPTAQLVESQPPRERLGKKLRRGLRNRWNALGDRLDQLLLPAEPGLAVAGGMLPHTEEPTRFDPRTDQHTEQYTNITRFPGSFPDNVRPANPGFVEVITNDGETYTVSDNPFARRQSWTRDDTKSRFAPRWFDKPVWFLEGLTIGLKNRRPFLDRLYEGVGKKAELAAGSPGFWINKQRLKRANKQEINEVVLSAPMLYVGKWIHKGANFLKHQAIHAGKIGWSLVKDFPFAGAVLSGVWATATGAPEEIPLNAALAALSIPLYAAEGTLIATIPVLGALLAGGLFAGNVLLNMYINGSLDRRYNEANDKMIPIEHRKMLIERDPRKLPHYDEAIKKSQATRKWQGKLPVLGFFGFRGKKLADKLQDAEQKLNPYPGFGDQSRVQKKYAQKQQELYNLGMTINVLEEHRRHQTARIKAWEFWKWMPIVGMNAGLNREIATYKQIYGWVDKGMYVYFEKPHADAATVAEMVEDIELRRPGYLES